MRILHISTRLILGGSQENTLLSCEGQARLGHDVHLAFGPIFGPEGSLLDRVERFNQRCRRGDERTTLGNPCTPITTHEIPNLVREVRPMRDRRAYYELVELIRTLKPDILHTHSSKAGILGRMAAWKVLMSSGGAGVSPAHIAELERARFSSPLQPNQMGVVHTIHGPPFMPIEGSLLQQLNVRAMNLAYTLAERHAARRCHAIVSVADAMTAQFLARGIGRPPQYTTVYSGMEVGPFLHAAPGESRDEIRRQLGVSENSFVIGTVARLAQHKGHDDLLDALAEDLRANQSWKLLWVGDGWWKDRLIAKAEQLGLRESIVLAGLVRPERIPGLIRAMDVLAHPSVREGLPRTVPQALLSGVMPIAYDVDGTSEACRELQTGRLVRPGDLAGLREAVRWAFAHEGERRRLAERGRAECTTRFAAETMVAELEKVYRVALTR